MEVMIALQHVPGKTSFVVSHDRATILRDAAQVVGGVNLFGERMGYGVTANHRVVQRTNTAYRHSRLTSECLDFSAADVYVGGAGNELDVFSVQGVVRQLCHSDAQLFSGWGGHPSVNDVTVLEKLSKVSQKAVQLLKVATCICKL